MPLRAIPDINGLIPQPRRRAVRVYANGDGRSIQELMGMADDESQFKQIVTLEKYPILRRYENAWPITAYLKKEFKPHGYISSWTRQSQKQNRGDSIASCPDSQARSQTRAVPASKGPSGTSLARVNRAMVVVTPRKTTLSSSAAVTHASPSTAPNRPRIPSGGNTRTRRPQRTSPSRDRVMTASTSSARSSNTVLGWIVSFDIPPADALRITELFASLGISDMVYLRVFARMESRNEWLREMRENGQLSEIQMRILRDMLERIATE
ncbi:hypothetical protein LXA43DRAFT_1153842 [Ganoderma leucocontextum]|nr:hypothetical protein LXA43DRAFT_1153842 [Ganoderma leucocontextum]